MDAPINVIEVSKNKTARRAAELLVSQDKGFLVPTPAQKKRLVVAFTKKNMIVYGKAFDIIKILGNLDLDNDDAVERNLSQVVLYEIKSTNRTLPNDFSGYFFALTTAELLVAQSLKEYYRFVFVNVTTGHCEEKTLEQVFQQAKGIYPTWSIKF